MADKIFQTSEHINKKDLEQVLEVNRKAIEIETEISGQNEEIIGLLTKSKILHDTTNEKMDKMIVQMNKVISQGEDTSKDLFKIQVLYITGLLTLVAQIIEIFLKK